MALFLHLFVYEEETIEFNVKQGKEEEAVMLLSKVYSYSPNHVHKEIYERKREEYLAIVERQG